MVDYAWDHAIISDRQYNNLKRNCNFSNQLIDIYSLYSPICVENQTRTHKNTQPPVIDAISPRLFSKFVMNFLMAKNEWMRRTKVVAVEVSEGCWCRRCWWMRVCFALGFGFELRALASTRLLHCCVVDYYDDNSNQIAESQIVYNVDRIVVETPE